MSRHRSLAALYVLVAASTLPASRVGAVTGSIAALAAIIAVSAYAAHVAEYRFVARRDALALTAALCLFYVVAAVRLPMHGDAVVPPGFRVAIFFAVFLAILFVVPRIVHGSDVLGVVSRVAAAAVLIGLPIVMLDGGGLIYNNRGFLLGYELPYYQSYLLNPNTLGTVSALGAVAAAAEFVRVRNRGAAVTAAICVSGVVGSGSRNAALGVIVGAAVLAVFEVQGRDGVIALLAVAVISAVTAVGMFLGVLPDPLGVSSVSLTYRDQLWAAGIQALARNPLLGVGVGGVAADIAPYHTHHELGIHNSYLRVVIEVGVIGGAAYIALLALGLSTAIKDTDTVVGAGVAAVFIASLSMQFFQGYTMLGLRASSLVPALMLGVVFTRSVGGDARG